MKRAAHGLCLLVVLALVLINCGKESGLEGKVVDGKGNPISGMKIMAKQVQPIKGYEQFEAITGSDGSFKLGGLFPKSEYKLLPWMQDTKFSASVNIQSGTQGETIMLPKLFAIRFMQTKDGIIKDSVVGVQWLPDLGRKDITWDEAQAYVRGLKAGGFSDWRLPTRVELKSLYDPSIGAEYKIDPLFQLSNCCPWTGELDNGDSSSAWDFSFGSGGACGGGGGVEGSGSRSASNGSRVLAVRSPR